MTPYKPSLESIMISPNAGLGVNEFLFGNLVRDSTIHQRPTKNEKDGRYTDIKSRKRLHVKKKKMRSLANIGNKKKEEQNQMNKQENTVQSDSFLPSLEMAEVEKRRRKLHSFSGRDNDTPAFPQRQPRFCSPFPLSPGELVRCAINTPTFIVLTLAWNFAG